MAIAYRFLYSKGLDYDLKGLNIKLGLALHLFKIQHFFAQHMIGQAMMHNIWNSSYCSVHMILQPLPKGYNLDYDLKGLNLNFLTSGLDFIT